VQNTIAMALGAETATTTVEGRERYAVVLRFPRDVRSDPEAIATQVLISLPAGGTVPLGEVATISRTQGPTMIRTEDGQLAVYVFVDIRDRDLGGYVREARKAVDASVKFPNGYYAAWSGQFEYLERAQQRMAVVIPATLLMILLLLYLNFRRLSDTLIVMLSLPFSLVGGLWLMDLMGFNISVAAVIGFIALAGVAAETGVIMLIYLNTALLERQADCRAAGRQFGRDDLQAAIVTGAVERVRPKMMTVCTIMAGLLPILWISGVGSEVMQRIAVPMIGGMVSSTILTLVVIPVLFFLYRSRQSRTESQ
jgi:Cu(I)/Ag(I) efflux system membrane protein CusA/SilA